MLDGLFLFHVTHLWLRGESGELWRGLSLPTLRGAQSVSRRRNKSNIVSAITLSDSDASLYQFISSFSNPSAVRTYRDMIPHTFHVHRVSFVGIKRDFSIGGALVGKVLN